MAIWSRQAAPPQPPADPGRPGSAAALPMAAWLAAAVWGTALVLSVPAWAQVEPVPRIAAERDVVEDPPGRAGRLAEVQGSAWLFHPEAGEWMSAQRNRPLTTGDRLSTDADGRLALQVGSSSLLLDGDTEIEVLRLDDELVEVELVGGSLGLRVRNPEAAREWVINTPEGRFRPLGAGRLRVDRSADLSQLTVWEGQARYEGPQSALTVQQGQRSDFWLDGNGVAQYSLGSPRPDGFEAWVAGLDRADAARAASRHVSPEMTGAEDLDRHGRWDQDPEYGAIWQPNEVPVGWAPYAAGHWAWVAPWGWSWVDDAPWGFAPFHYGRWVHVRNRWAWAPGRYVARPVYAPALVGWLGGGGVSVTIGTGPAVGWFPLAPREAYVPYRKVSPRYVRVVNGPHFRNGGDIERLIQSPSTVLRGIEYRNRKFHHGTTAVPVHAFQQRGRITPVRPEWRGDQVSREFDRLPATPVGAVGRPEGLRPGGAAPAWRTPAERREAGRDGPRAGWRPDARDDRPGSRPDGRPDGRPEGRPEGRDPREPRWARGDRGDRGVPDGRQPGDPRAPRGGQAPIQPPTAPVLAPVAPPAMPVAPPVMATPAAPSDRVTERARQWANGRNRPEPVEPGRGQGAEPEPVRPGRPQRFESPNERMAPPQAAMPPVQQMPRMAAPRLAPPPPMMAPPAAPMAPAAAAPQRTPREAAEQRQPRAVNGRERMQQH